MNRLTNRQRTTLICVLLGAITFAVFWPVLHSGFIRLDDPQYVSENGHVNSGLTWDNVKWSFQAGYASNWHPLTWMSHMLDVQWFGLHPGGHHFVNLFLHTANSVLLFLLFQRMTGATWRSATVAALFALHPLHVESVAWVSERKDVLSTLFFLLTLGAYARYTGFAIRNPKFRMATWGWYGLALLLFALGLMSKPMLVTLPFVLLLLDLWPLKRVSSFQTQNSTPSDRQLNRQSPTRLLLEKVPFFALAVVSCAITLLAQSKGHSVSTMTRLPLDARVANAVISCQEYLAKTIVPAKLAVFYPHPAIRPDAPDPWTDGRFILGALLLSVISFSALARLRREPWLATGWFWFLGTLVPVIGIVQVGTQAMADRYTYVPLIGLFVCAVWAVADFFGGRRWGTQLLTAAGVLVIAACSVMTWQQASFWKNDLTLFNHALAVTANNAVAHNIVGEALLDQGEYESANEHFRAALEADPSNAIARYDFSVALARYGFALAKAGKLEAAAQQYQASLQIRPTAQVYNSLGAVLSRLDKRDEALQQYAAALQLDPDYADGHFNFGVALALTGKIDDAVAHFQEVVRLKPDSLEARTHLAELLIRQGKFDDAVAQLEEVLRRRPGPEVYRQLAFARIMQGKIEQAVDSLEQAIHLDPNFPPALNDLAWLRATAPEARWRNGEEAVKLAEHACELTGSKQALFLGTLAAAYAEAGRFNDARKSAEQAVALATAEGNKDLAERNRQLLELYRSGKPYHEAARQ